MVIYFPQSRQVDAPLPQHILSPANVTNEWKTAACEILRLVT
jgi:hypothetical protein